jgi:hypothetical protein
MLERVGDCGGVDSTTHSSGVDGRAHEQEDSDMPLSQDDIDHFLAWVARDYRAAVVLRCRQLVEDARANGSFDPLATLTRALADLDVRELETAEVFDATRFNS